MKKITTIKALARELAKLEAKKKQVNIAQMSEIVGKLSDLAYGGRFKNLHAMLKKNGQKRASKK